MKTLDDAVAILKAARRALVVSHVPPDGDGLGSGICIVRMLRSLGAEAIFAAGGPVQDCLGFLAGPDEIDTTSDGPPGPFDVSIALDSGNLERLRKLGPCCRRASHFLNLDHHATNTRYGTLNWIDPDAAATGELVFRLITPLGLELTEELALPLYVALVTDTGRFSYSNATPDTHRIAAELLAAGVNPVDATDRLYRSLPLPLLKLQALGVRALEIDAGGLAAHLTVTREMVRESGADPKDVGDLVDIPISVAGVEVGVLFRDAPDGHGTKVSLRSRRWFRVNEFAGRWGGGGHPRAAGALIESPLNEARTVVLEALFEALADGEGADG
ncbi:MAG: DHH family phosphoesterase [Planctomycetota bacterium]